MLFRACNGVLLLTLRPSCARALALQRAPLGGVAEGPLVAAELDAAVVHADVRHALERAVERLECAARCGWRLLVAPTARFHV